MRFRSSVTLARRVRGGCAARVCERVCELVGLRRARAWPTLRRSCCHYGSQDRHCDDGVLWGCQSLSRAESVLNRRGHQPVIATGAFYRETIECAGIEFQPVRPDADPTDRAMLRGSWIPNWAPNTFCATWCCAFARFV